MDPRRGQGRYFDGAEVIALNLEKLRDYVFGRHVGMLNNKISWNGATTASGEQAKSR
jgi:hypothetical protein